MTLFVLAQQVADASAWTPDRVGVLVGAIAGAIISIIGAWKLAKIEAHVNSEKTALHEQAVAKDMEVTLLRQMLEERKTTAALLAQAASHAVSAGTTPKVSVATETAIIETADNTKAIERNTDKTKQDVAELKEAQS